MDKYYLIEYIEYMDDNIVPQVVGEFESQKEALDRLNSDIEGSFRGAPNLTFSPEAYIIKGEKINIKIIKKGIIE